MIILVIIVVILLWVWACKSQETTHVSKSSTNEMNKTIEEKKYSDEFEETYPWIYDAMEIEEKDIKTYDDVKRYSKLAKEAKIEREKMLSQVSFSRKRVDNDGGQLSRRLREIKDVAYNIYTSNKDKNFKDKLLSIIDGKGLKDSEVYTKAEISRQVFNNIINIKGYLPKKTTVFRLILSLELNMEEAEELLKLSGHSFCELFYEDVYVMVAIKNNFYDVKKIYKEITSMEKELSKGN